MAETNPEHLDEAIENLGRLNAYTPEDEASKSFLKSMCERSAQYGERMYISFKQLAWLRSIHEAAVEKGKA